MEKYVINSIKLLRIVKGHILNKTHSISKDQGINALIEIHGMALGLLDNIDDPESYYQWCYEIEQEMKYIKLLNADIYNKLHNINSIIEELDTMKVKFKMRPSIIFSLYMVDVEGNMYLEVENSSLYQVLRKYHCLCSRINNIEYKAVDANDTSFHLYRAITHNPVEYTYDKNGTLDTILLKEICIDYKEN